MRFYFFALSLVTASCSQVSAPSLVEMISASEAASGEVAVLAEGVLDVPRAEYPKIAAKASKGDIGSIRQVQLVTGHGDGAASFGQTLTIQKILDSAGDEAFAEALLTQSRQVILAHAKFRNPRYEVHIDRKRFPKSNQMISNAEQEAAKQNRWH